MTQEKRKYQRIKILEKIVIKYRLRKIDAVAYNISSGGLNFVTPEIFLIDDTCTIILEKNNIKLEKKIVIRWRKYINDKPGMVNYGSEFDTILSDKDIENICKPSVK
jgi:hypothetical protein